MFCEWLLVLSLFILWLVYGCYVEWEKEPGECYISPRAFILSIVWAVSILPLNALSNPEVQDVLVQRLVRAVPIGGQTITLPGADVESIEITAANIVIKYHR